MIVAAAEPPTVRLYRTDVAAFRDEHWANLVTEADRAALPPSARQQRRAEHLAGRALLRVALQDWTGRPALSHTLRVGPNGKPECVDGPELGVAHSRGVVLCVLAPVGRIGVDVELPVPGRAIGGIADRYFSGDESRWIGGRSERFYMLWVLKEAYLKALGVGLSGGLDALRCAIDPPRIDADAPGSRERPALALYAIETGFAAVARLGRGLDDVPAWRWVPGAPLSAVPRALVARTA